jgi:hypothetical protein
MSALKQQIIDLIERMPENITVDDVIEELTFKIEVDAGLDELNNALGIEHDEAKERLSKWLK